MAMTVRLLHKLTDVSSCLFEELTDGYSEVDLARDFWKYLKSRILDDSTKKVRVSEYVRERIMRLDEKAMKRKFGLKLSTVKKSSAQLDYVSSCVSTMLHHSSYGQKIIDWS